MESNSNEKVYAFDSLYTTNHIEMLKILLPCLHPPLQRTLALYIKFLELRYTFSFLRAHPYAIRGCGFDTSPADWQFLQDDLRPYLTPEEAGRLEQIRKSAAMMKQFSSIRKNMEALKGILPEGMDLESLFRNMAEGFAGGESGRENADGNHQDKVNAAGTEKTEPYAAGQEAHRRKIAAQNGAETQSDGSDQDAAKTGQGAAKAANLLKNMLGQGGSSEDMMKHMMSSSQMELFQKFNERFQNISCIP